MRALRYLYVLALVAWLGGMLVAGLLVAPTVFEVLDAHDPARGRATAGAIVAAVLHRLHLLGYVAGAVMFVSLTLQRLLGPRPAAYGVRAGIVAAMLALSAYSGFVVSPRLEALQREVGGPVAQLAQTDGRRAVFDRLHRLSTVLLGLVTAGGLVLIGWETRE